MNQSPVNPIHAQLAHASIYASIYASINASINAPIYLCIHPSIHSSIHPSIHPPIHPSTHPSINLFIHRRIDLAGGRPLSVANRRFACTHTHTTHIHTYTPHNTQIRIHKYAHTPPPTHETRMCTTKEIPFPTN